MIMRRRASFDNRVLRGRRILSALSASLLVMVASAGPVEAAKVGAARLVSVATDGTQGNADSEEPAFSPDAKSVLFTSAASNLVAGDTNHKTDVFLRDLVKGTTTRVSVAADGAQANGDSYGARFSAGGRTIIFTSRARNLVEGVVNDGSPQVYMKDLATGAVTEVSADAAGEPAAEWADDGYLSADLKTAYFSAVASNFTPNGASTCARWSWKTGSNLCANAYAKDLVTGRVILLSKDRTGRPGDGASFVSGALKNREGALLVSEASTFAKTAPATCRLVSDVNEEWNCHNLFTASKTQVLRQLAWNKGGTAFDEDLATPSMSSDGRKLVFSSFAHGLSRNDEEHCVGDDMFMPPRRCFDVYVKDMSTGRITTVSAVRQTDPATDDSRIPMISANGEVVVFWSFVDALDPSVPPTHSRSVYARFLKTGEIVKVTRGLNGKASDGYDDAPVVSGGGRRVAFTSTATNLVPVDENRKADVFVVDIAP